MNKKRIDRNEANKSRPRDRYLSEELANLVLLTFESIHKNEGKFHLYESIHFLNRYIKLLEKYIIDKDTLNALKVQVCLDHAFYNLGLGKPIYLEWAARKGGHANKIKKGIWTAIEKYLPQSKIKTPSYLWSRFEKVHSGEDNAYETPDLNYEIWFGKDVTDNKRNSGYLIQKSFDDKESSITFKTFERYFYKIKHKMDFVRP